MVLIPILVLLWSHTEAVAPMYEHSLVRKIKEASTWQQAISLLPPRSQLNNSPHILSAAISILPSTEWRRAMDLWGSIENPDKALLHCYLGCLCKAGRGKEAEGALFNPPIRQPDNHSLNLVLMCYRANHEWRGVLRIMEMAREKMPDPPDVYPFVTAIKACAECERFSDAAKLLRDCWDTQSDSPGSQSFWSSCSVYPSPTLVSSSRVEEELINAQEYLWKMWSQCMLAQIKVNLINDIKCGKLTPKDETETYKLYNSLGKAADEGIMPSFTSAGARSGYLIDKLVARASRTADFIREIQKSRKLRNLIKYPLISIGGGPGFDLVGHCLIKNFEELCLDTRRQKDEDQELPMILDLEPGRSYAIILFSQFNYLDYHSFYVRMGGMCMRSKKGNA